jgi:O-antigen/teichoic acid export membrane protein
MTKNLTHGEPARLILFFTLPLIAGNIFQQLYAFVDTLIVGRFLGVEALAAVGCTGSLMFLMLGFVIGFSTGITIYTGQRYGAKDYQGVRQSAAACAILSRAQAPAQIHPSAGNTVLTAIYPRFAATTCSALRSGSRRIKASRSKRGRSIHPILFMTTPAHRSNGQKWAASGSKWRRRRCI